MKFLKEGILKLSNDIEKVANTLEDSYKYPQLDKKLDQFRKRLTTFHTHTPIYTSDDPRVVENESGHAYALILECGNALALLENVTAENNVFDIIDSLRAVDKQISRCLPDPDLIDTILDAWNLLNNEESLDY